MDFEFWNNCWLKPSQPFHLRQPHYFLKRYFKQYFADKDKVLLPLCGKTQDLIYIAEQGVQAVGIEFNPKAVKSFYADSKLSPSTTSIDDKTLFRSNHIDLWLADFFDVTQEDVGRFEVIFDRAALVALPDDLRQRYVGHLKSLLAPGGVILLVTMDYNSAEMSGPPFFIDESLIIELFQGANVELIDQHNILDSHPRWKELELSYLNEKLYKIHY